MVDLDRTPPSRWEPPRVTITFVANEHTPREYLRYEGMTVEMPSDTLVPAGPGTLRGIPGYFQGHDWVMTAPIPTPPDPGPPWARALSEKLDAIKALLEAGRG